MVRIALSNLKYYHRRATNIIHENHLIGRRVRVALIGIICDHPALCKMVGCADKKHNRSPCPVCTIGAEDLHSDNSIVGKG